MTVSGVLSWAGTNAVDWTPYHSIGHSETVPLRPFIVGSRSTAASSRRSGSGQMSAEPKSGLGQKKATSRVWEGSKVFGLPGPTKV